MNGKTKRRFTILHGFAVSIAIHAVLGLPFLVSVVAAPPDEPPLLIDLQDAVPDSQDLAVTKQSDVDQRKGDPQKSRPVMPKKDAAAQQSAPVDEQPMDVAKNDEATHNLPQPAPTTPAKAVDAPPPAPEMNAAPDDNNVKGANEYVPPARRIAQPEITDEQYDALLIKQINQHTVYPDEWKRARVQGAARVSFTILPNGDLSPESVKVVASSGKSAIDARALDTIRASAPFPPPERQMTIAITVRFGETR